MASVCDAVVAGNPRRLWNLENLIRFITAADYDPVVRELEEADEVDYYLGSHGLTREALAAEDS